MTGFGLIIAILLILLLAVGLYFFFSPHYQPYIKMLALNLEREITHPVQPPHQHLTLPIGKDNEISLGWVGHTTWIIEFLGTTLITDPMFSNRASLARRLVAPALKPEDIQSLDLTLLSHAHSDHLDVPSLKVLPSQAKLLYPQGDENILRSLPQAKVPLEPNQEYKVKDLSIKVYQAHHQGNSITGNTSDLTLIYLLKKKKHSLVFMGDTAYTPSLGDAIRKECPEGVDVVIVPIAAYSPDSFQKDHCTPEQAIQFALDMRARLIVPMHHETFILSLEPIDEPLRRFNEAAAAAKVSDRIRSLPIGGTLRIVSTPQGQLQ